MRLLGIILSVLVVLTFPACAMPTQGACGVPPTVHLGLPSMDVPPPLMLLPTQVPPQFVAQSYAQVMQVPMQQQYAACPTYQAPAPASACAPPQGYSQGFQYAQPPAAPTPRAAGDCR